MNWAVILAGGTGERFWPASTPERPKQLLPLVSDRSMLRETFDRLDGLLSAERALVLTNGPLAEAVGAELPEVPAGHVIGEPHVRDTAPAIGLAAGLLAAREPEAVLLVLPADHAIGDPEAFRASASAAFQIAAEQAVLVLFGIVPSRPETAYGYIRRGGPHALGSEAFEVETFVEKPNPATAGRIWRDGRHYWNSGLFCGRASVFLDEYAIHLPLMRRAIDSAVASWRDDPARALVGYYDAVEATSIDYGIMQQTERAVVLPANDWGWDDVGSWEALGRWLEPTPDGNVEIGECALEDCRDVIAWAEDGRISALGMRDVVIVRSGGETLVAARDALDGIKAFVRKIAPPRHPGPGR
ncbi:MAG TPA: sugar phosphate nucleotidyltransferase [Gemmatimonadota bacterium]|nr:sugar phosphate nucleotidyltransferase [Gemmatimonadota bacterium]